MAPRTHVWMLNMGGPDRPEAVRPFIEQLLSDPEVVQLPAGLGWLRPVLAWLVARLRAPKLLPVYERLGGASPQLRMVEEQALALGRVLGERYACRPVLRYSAPTADEAAESLLDGDQLVLLSLYPHACRATTGTSLADARRAVKAAGRAVAVAEVGSYPADPGYVEAVAETVREAIRELPDGADYAVLFSAHGIPERLARAGDPYPGEIRATVEALVERIPLERPHHLSYQSRVGPARWLGPTLDW